MPIKNTNDLKNAATYFHKRNIGIVIITGIKIQELSPAETGIFISYNNNHYMIKTKEYEFAIPPNGTGDLFSSVFLGSYLTTKNPVESLRRAVYFTDLVMKNTSLAQSRELLITSVNYSTLDTKLLPNIIKL